MATVYMSLYLGIVKVKLNAKVSMLLYQCLAGKIGDRRVAVASSASYSVSTNNIIVIVSLRADYPSIK